MIIIETVGVILSKSHITIWMKHSAIYLNDQRTATVIRTKIQNILNTLSSIRQSSSCFHTCNTPILRHAQFFMQLWVASTYQIPSGTLDIATLYNKVLVSYFFALYSKKSDRRHMVVAPLRYTKNPNIKDSFSVVSVANYARVSFGQT